MAEAMEKEDKTGSLWSEGNDADLLFFSSIEDKATKIWLKSLHQMWDLWRKCEGVVKTLTDYFETAPNPYLSMLRILVNTSDFNNAKSTSLAFTVVEEFQNWLTDQKDLYKGFLVPDLKIAAFQLVSKQKNMQLFKMVAVIYEFSEHNGLFLHTIEKLLQEKKYKEAAQYVTMFQLHSKYIDPNKILFPLILQNKLTIVEEFLADSPEAQRALVKYLDNIISTGNNMHDALDEYVVRHNIPDVKMSTVQIRPMTKLISRLVKQYNMPDTVCPNLTQRRNEGALQFVMHKRYTDGSLNVDSWREMAKEAIGDNAKLQVDIVKMLMQINDPEEAFYWAQVYNVPRQKWPWGLAEHVESKKPDSLINHGASTSRNENWDANNSDAVEYHTLRLSRNCIKIINDTRSFEQFLDEGLKEVSIIGIDSEWKPSFGTKKPELALIQIATRRYVYILDVTTMGGLLAELWTELSLTLFENKNILKLGFGIAHDICVIRESLPALAKVKGHGEDYVDLLHLWKKLDHGYRITYPYEGDKNFTNENLSKLVELCLGKRLNKSDQFSNWERRPLRESQIIYAALDAYCLLEVYDVLREQCREMGLSIFDICTEISLNSHKSPKKTTKLVTKNSGRSQEDCDRRSNHSEDNAYGYPNYDHSQKLEFNNYRGNQRGRGNIFMPRGGYRGHRGNNSQRGNNRRHRGNNRGRSYGYQTNSNESKDDQHNYNNPGNSHQRGNSNYNEHRGHSYHGEYHSNNQQNNCRWSNPHLEQRENDEHNEYRRNHQYSNEHRVNIQKRNPQGKIYNQGQRVQNAQALPFRLESFTSSPQRPETPQSSHNQGNNAKSESSALQRLQSFSLSDQPRVFAHKWRVVCDSMLKGLATKLRQCGCDCVHLTFYQGGDESAKLAMRENRVLLTRNKGHQKLAQYVPQSKCYNVISDTHNHQLREVLSHFNVVVTRRDIFSRCYACNYDEFVMVSKDLMEQLMKSFSKFMSEKRRNYSPMSNSFGGVNNDEDQVLATVFNALRRKDSQDRTWQLNTGTLDVEKCITKYEMRIQMDKVPMNVLQNTPFFYICEHCGKVYWDGTHLERNLNEDIKDIIVDE